jgi:hypothetical protein
MKATKKQLAFCEEHEISFDQFIGKDVIERTLYLNSVTKLVEGFNPTVCGSLCLDSVTKPIKGFNPTVGGNLSMDSVTEVIEGFNPTVGGSLWLDSVTKLVKGFNPTVGDSLCMDSVTELVKGFNPTVGGYLWMDSVTKLIKGFNPTVGSNLSMDSVTKLIKGFNPTVGGCLSMDSVTDKDSISFTKINGDFIDFKNGYISCEGIFMEVDSHRGNVWIGHKVGKKEKIFLVTDGNQKYSHGETLKEAKEDLIFKVDGRRPDDFKHLNKESVLLMSEAIVAYRVITGACGFGVKDYIKNRLPKEKEEFSMAEVIELTKDEYGGNRFSEFIG